MFTSHFKNSDHKNSSGFTLVEVLVALVVLSIGMLGIAALYVESLRAGRSALIRSQAVTLASDMADRIRANRQGDGAYAKGIATHPATDSACEPSGSGCVPAVMAAHDLAVWDEEVTANLPGGTCSVVAADAGGGIFTYTITVNWAETGQTADLSYVMRIQA
jgi:type IV pilus assembly protein PilV